MGVLDMSKKNLGSKKGYVIVVTLIISLFLTITAITISTIVFRYSDSITERVEDLREKVYDDGSLE